MIAGSKFFNVLSTLVLSAAYVTAGAGFTVVATSTQVEAAAISRIQIFGAQRAGDEAVRSNLTIRPGMVFSDKDIDESVKKLYDTGYFSDVRISVSGGALLVTVKENQLINQIVFNGNRKITDDKLQGVVRSQPLGPFDPTMITADIERIKGAYRAIGRSDVEISTQSIPVAQGRLNVAFIVNEGERTKIADIKFVGNNAYGEQRLKAVILTKESGPLSFLTRKDVYTEEKLRTDEEALQKFYYNHGYADFRIISSNAVLDESHSKYEITFTIDEGQHYQYGEISVDSTVPNITGDELKGEVETKKGDVYDARRVQETMDAISKRVSSAGYPFARVTPRGNRDIAGHTIGISYTVDPGERAYVERIEIRGNTRTRDYVIRREFDFNEGDAFNQSMIARAKSRLEALGFFTSVSISTAQGSASDRVVIIVDVEDQSTGSFGIGAGYSGDDGVLLEASVEEKNFLGRGQYIRLAAGVGSDDAQTYNISFTEPYFLGYRLAAGFDLFKTQTSSNDYYTYNEQGVTFRITAPISEDLATTFRYTYKQISYGEDGAYGDDGIAYTSDDEMSAPFIALIEHGAYAQSSVSQTLTYNTLDSQTKPREGVYATATHEFAGLGGDSNFYKLSARARYYHTLSTDADLVGSLAVAGGHVFNTNGEDLNVFDQFSIGRQIRGFKSDGIGARTVDDGDALGGTTYFTASAEVSVPMPGLPEDFGLRAAIFTDAGTLFGNSVDGRGEVIEGTGLSWRASVGAGIVWDSPFGNIRIDYAEPVVKESFDKVEQFRFSMSNPF